MKRCRFDSSPFHFTIFCIKEGMFYSLKKSFERKQYIFFSPLGWLMSREATKKVEDDNYLSLPKKAADALNLVDKPYLIETDKAEISHKQKGVNCRAINIYARLVIWLYRHFYFGLWLLSHLRMNVFENSEQAIDAFCKIHPADQKVLCLPRSVFAATLSKRFKRNGVMVIGAFLPSRHLHAFIIEDSRNPCSFDTAWINYTPIAVMS